MDAVKRPNHAVIQPLLILAVPNEIIFEILANLSPSNIRSISNTNARLRILAEDKLRRDNEALFFLPSELILNIAQHLSARDCSRFARASHRHHSLITEKILRENVEKGGSSLLYCAATRNSIRMAWRLLEYGADINAQYGSLSEILDKRMNLLLFATHHEHLDIVNLLLEFGALHYLTEQRAPLMLAISRQHDHVALALAQALQSAGADIDCVRPTPLQMACKNKMVHLVKQLLEYKTPSKAERIQNMDYALYYAVVRERNFSGFLKRELHQDDYEIALMLLERGANPDATLHGVGARDCDTARSVSSRHPDPRIRALLMKPGLPVDPTKYGLQVGRFWTQPSQTESPLFQDFYSVNGYSEETFRVRLGELLKQSAVNQTTEMSNNERPTRTKTVYGSLHSVRPIRLASLSFFPPLEASNANPKLANESSPFTVPASTDPIDTTRVQSLGRKSAASFSDFGVTTWAEICKGKDYRRGTVFRGMSNVENETDGVQGAGGQGKRKMKMKWIPLQL